MPGWHDLSHLLEAEFVQSLEEGRDPAGIETLRQEATHSTDDAKALEALHARVLHVPIRADFSFVEPDDLEGIRSLRERLPGGHESTPPGNLADRMQGAWEGRCVGCALGKPVEMFMDPHNGMSSRERQKRYLEAVSPDEWPLRDYFPAHSPAEPETGGLLFPQSTREQIAFMETDDDIRYTILGLMVLSDHGSNFDTWHVARAWMEHLGYAKVCTAETQAYRNMVQDFEFHGAVRRDPPEPDVWHEIATRLNPYREWIGAQIRVDAYGYFAAGRPGLAAEFAFRDARMTHVKNGIYGAMFCAAMIAAAFVEEDVRAIVKAGLAEIPATSRLHHEVRWTADLCAGADFSDFEQIFDKIEKRLAHYNPVHTINNSAICVAALLLSGGDFEKGITLAVMGGWDTDCNGATVGSILGAFQGSAGVPPFWKARLNDTLHAGITGFDPIPIHECASRCLALIGRDGN